MKAIVKKTGEIVDVKQDGYVKSSGPIWVDRNYNYYLWNQVELLD